jgi:hypothetical protein
LALYPCTEIVNIQMRVNGVLAFMERKHGDVSMDKALWTRIGSPVPGNPCERADFGRWGYNHNEYIPTLNAKNRKRLPLLRQPHLFVAVAVN